MAVPRMRTMMLSQLFSGSHYFSIFFWVAAPLKWSFQERVPFVLFSRVTEQLSCGSTAMSVLSGPFMLMGFGGLGGTTLRRARFAASLGARQLAFRQTEGHPDAFQPRIMRNASVAEQLKAAHRSFDVLGRKPCPARPVYDNVAARLGSVESRAAGWGLFTIGPPARCPFTVSFLVGRLPLPK